MPTKFSSLGCDPDKNDWKGHIQNTQKNCETKTTKLQFWKYNRWKYWTSVLFVFINDEGDLIFFLINSEEGGLWEGILLKYANYKKTNFRKTYFPWL